MRAPSAIAAVLLTGCTAAGTEPLVLPTPDAATEYTINGTVIDDSSGLVGTEVERGAL